MSFPEVLDAARALPRDEQLKLAAALFDDATPDDAAVYGFSAEVRSLLPPPTGAIEIRSPFDAVEAAYVLKALLDAEAKRS